MTGVETTKTQTRRLTTWKAASILVGGAFVASNLAGLAKEAPAIAEVSQGLSDMVPLSLMATQSVLPYQALDRSTEVHMHMLWQDAGDHFDAAGRSGYNGALPFLAGALVLGAGWRAVDSHRRNLVAPTEAVTE